MYGLYYIQSMCHHHVHRETGYELTPLRLDLEACVEQPQLHMEADADHGLHFSYPASILLHREHVSYVKYTLIMYTHVYTSVTYVHV